MAAESEMSAFSKIRKAATEREWCPERPSAEAAQLRQKERRSPKPLVIAACACAEEALLRRANSAKPNPKGAQASARARPTALPDRKTTGRTRSTMR